MWNFKNAKRPDMSLSSFLNCLKPGIHAPFCVLDDIYASTNGCHVPSMYVVGEEGYPHGMLLGTSAWGCGWYCDAHRVFAQPENDTAIT